MNQKIWIFVLTLFALFAGIGLGRRLLAQAEPEAAQESAAALTTAFTYQGQLQDGGSPANGAYDLQFTLYDALSGGAAVGSSVTLNDVSVSDGIFTVELDFGGSYALQGTAGQPDAGVLSGGSYALGGGFWQGGAAQTSGESVYLPLIIRAP